MKKLLGVAGALALVGLVAWAISVSGRTDPAITAPADQSGDPVVSLAEGLEVPWDLSFLPDGDIIVTERPGRVRLVDAVDGLLSEPVLELPQVAHQGEGGLLGMALHPRYPDPAYVYLYYTYESPAGTANRVSRFPFDGMQARTEEVVLEEIPGGRIHDGGRISFGPDGMLYITTGDAGNASLAQDRNSLAGKILRVTAEGDVPPDNPFRGSPVYSLGHRNPQGLAWDADGRLWETEHGSSATDELNRIQPGGNYGWPVVRGDESAPGMEPPVLHSGLDTWAPSGMASLGGSLYFAGLRGSSLYEVSIEKEPDLLRHLHGDFGRLRTAVAGPDDFLYLLTSNRDGRGTPLGGDDRLVRINPDAL